MLMIEPASMQLVLKSLGLRWSPRPIVYCLTFALMWTRLKIQSHRRECIWKFRGLMQTPRKVP